MSLHQPSLFTTNVFGGAEPRTPPLSSPSDPATSHEAAERHQASGKIDGHAMIVLRLLMAHPGSTFAELFEAATGDEKRELVDNKEVCRRLDTLAKLRLARRVVGADGKEVARACRVNGTRKTVWEVVPNPDVRATVHEMLG